MATWNSPGGEKNLREGFAPWSPLATGVTIIKVTLFSVNVIWFPNSSFQGFTKMLLVWLESSPPPDNFYQGNFPSDPHPMTIILQVTSPTRTFGIVLPGGGTDWTVTRQSYNTTIRVLAVVAMWQSQPVSLAYAAAALGGLDNATDMSPPPRRSAERPSSRK